MEVSSASVTQPRREVVAGPYPGWKPRLRALLRLDWLPRSEEAAVPLWVHALFWGLLLFFDGLIIFFDYTDAKNHHSLKDMLVRAGLTNVLSALLFYTNWMVLIPHTLSRGRLWPYVAGVLLLLLAYIPLRFGVSLVLEGAAEDAHNKGQVVSMIVPYGVMGLMAIFLSSALRITGDYLRGQRNRREMERQQLLTELAMLKTQINPHFLFNTLNNIYSLTSRKSDKAPEAVLRLAEIMRYLLYESSTDTVPLSRELAHLRSFLDLQRLRMSAAAQEAIQLDITGASPDCAHPIAPLLLLPLVENAFKHGDLTARPVAVHITLELAADGRLRFAVLNHVAAADAARELPAQPGGVGLVNLRRRLELLYPGCYTLEVQTPPGQHLVTLTLRSE